MKRKYDCIRRPHDPTAIQYCVPEEHAKSLPRKVDLRPNCPPVYDQGDLGSCTGNGWAFIVHWLLITLGLGDWIPSRLFIYWRERVIEGDTADDSGAAVSDGAKTLAQKGVCKETTWPYIVSQFAVCPPVAAFAEAARHLVSGLAHINNKSATAIKSALASNLPVVMGFTVYESFESDEVAKTGLVPMPKPGEQELGGHCVVIVGYDDDFVFPADWKVPNGGWIVRNSWGALWGLAGYYVVPYAYYTNTKYASDFWTAKKVS